MSGLTLVVIVLWTVCWVATVAIETTVLAVLLSPRHGWRVRLFAGMWLSACTLPVVWLALPDALPMTFSRAAVVAVAEVFALLTECGIFWWAFIRPRPPDRRATIRDLVAIVAANLASFVTGEAVWLLLSW
jgi:hypothetical protein